MANRTQEFGMDVAISRKLNSKYDQATEQEVVNWINSLVGTNLPLGRENVCNALKSGQVLVKLVNVIYDGTQNLPKKAAAIKRPIRFTTMSAPFKQMENIEIFLNTCLAYGVTRASMFQTVDLYECKNMAQVLNCILQLGTECQRNGFNGPCCGPRPTSENRREFSEEQLKLGEGIIGLQAGTNKMASQKGMSIGTARHIADIKCEEMTREGQAVIGLQMGTNQCASQKGMAMGANRHIADTSIQPMCMEGQGIIGLQMGTNQCASQKGMSMGGQRHIADIKCDDASRAGQGFIGLQAGSNQGASQAGMRFGGQRHIADLQVEEMDRSSSNQVSLQMGPSQDQVASQSGMSFGSQRHILDSH